MSSLLGVLQKSGGGQMRTVTTQAALVRNNTVWQKQEEHSKISPSENKELQRKHDEDYQKTMFWKSSLHEIYKIDPLTASMGAVASVVSGLAGEVLRPRHAPSAGPRDQDADLVFRPGLTVAQLLDSCAAHLDSAQLPPPLPRSWSPSFPPHTSPAPGTDTTAIGTKLDNFRLEDPRVLDWTSRRWRVLEEVLLHRPDLVTLQEVDHFPFLAAALASVGYCGRFMPKPDSACKYIQNNNGPDGVAVFYKKTKFQLVKEERRVLEAWGAATNQVALAMVLRLQETGRELCLATTHLKARKGPLLANIRDQQGADLAAWLHTVRGGRSVILTGDFNAEPAEPVYATITGGAAGVPLRSSYAVDSLDYTTWKIRDTGEEKHVLDYVFHSPDLETARTLDMPAAEHVGADRFPSLQYASDHLSLVTDIAT